MYTITVFGRCLAVGCSSLGCCALLCRAAETSKIVTSGHLLGEKPNNLMTVNVIVTRLNDVGFTTADAASKRAGRKQNLKCAGQQCIQITLRPMGSSLCVEACTSQRLDNNIVTCKACQPPVYCLLHGFYRHITSTNSEAHTTAYYMPQTTHCFVDYPC